MSRVLSSPPIFKDNSSGSITSSVQSEQSEISLDPKSETTQSVNIGQLFDAVATEQRKLQKQSSVKDKLADFLAWSQIKKQKINK
jgi:hypothetical protein